MSFCRPRWFRPVTSLCQHVQAESYHYPSSFLNTYLGGAPHWWTRLASAIYYYHLPKTNDYRWWWCALFTCTISYLLFQLRLAFLLPLYRLVNHLAWSPEAYMGSLGVTGSSLRMLVVADVILAVGSRPQILPQAQTAWSRRIALNVQAHDLVKHDAPLMVDAKIGLEALADALSSYQVDGITAPMQAAECRIMRKLIMSPKPRLIMNYQQIQRLLVLLMSLSEDDCGGCGWLCRASYINYGALAWQMVITWNMDFCMGYEVAAGLGVHPADHHAQRRLCRWWLLLMANSELQRWWWVSWR